MAELALLMTMIQTHKANRRVDDAGEKPNIKANGINDISNNNNLKKKI